MAIGASLSPHMFRTAAASSAVVHAGYNQHLASALLHHRDRCVTVRPTTLRTTVDSPDRVAILWISATHYPKGAWALKSALTVTRPSAAKFECEL
jgi:hypothetical protein